MAAAVLSCHQEAEEGEEEGEGEEDPCHQAAVEEAEEAGEVAVQLLEAEAGARAAVSVVQVLVLSFPQSAASQSLCLWCFRPRCASHLPRRQEPCPPEFQRSSRHRFRPLARQISSHRPHRMRGEYP